MSIRLMNRVYEKEVDAPTQRVLLVLCDHANDHGRCWPSMPLIAWKLGISERTVIRSIQRLEQSGAVTVQRNLGKVNRYDIDLERLPDKTPLLTECHPGQNVTPDTDVTPPMTKRHATSDIAVSPEPPRTKKEPPSGSLHVIDGGAKPKPAVKGDKPEHLFVNEYYRIAGGAPTNHGRDLGHAKKLLSVGVFASDIPSLIEWAQTSYYTREGFDLGTFVTHINKWRTWRSNRPAKADAKGGLVYG